MGGRKERLLCLTAGGFVVAVPLFFVSLKRRHFLSLSGDMEKQASSHPPYSVLCFRENREHLKYHHYVVKWLCARDFGCHLGGVNWFLLVAFSLIELFRSGWDGYMREACC